MMQTRELLAKVRKIEIKTRKIVDEITGGAYHSVFKGRGIEFSEVRAYSPDDDVRDIDWNVTARMGDAYIKQYIEERELTVILAVDVSPSGDFGTGDTDKREKMAETAALLAFSAIRNNDKVGLLLFSDRVELYLPPRSGRTHALRVIRELVAHEPEGHGTDLTGTLEFLARTQKKKAVIFLLSDFLVPDFSFERPLKIVARKHDLAAFRVLDDLELAVPATAAGLTLYDAETGEQMYFDATKAAAQAYARAENAYLAEQDDLFRRAKVDRIDLRCSDDLVRPLMRFFQTRRRRK